VKTRGDSAAPRSPSPIFNGAQQWGDSVMAQYVLHPDNHKIIIPSSSYNVPKDIHRFLLGMASSLRELLSLHDNSRTEDHDLILEAFEEYLSSVSPRFEPLKQFQIYSTHEVKSWQYSMWLIHRLRYFILDKPKLIHRICEVRKARERESARMSEASAYWDSDMVAEGFVGKGNASQPEVSFPEDFDLDSATVQ
jgi:hypothetical protein